MASPRATADTVNHLLPPKQDVTATGPGKDNPLMSQPAQDIAIHQDFAAVSDLFATDIADPHALYAEYRRTMPVMEGDILARFNVPSQADYSNLGRPVFTLFKHRDVLDVLRDSKTFTSTLLNEGLGQFLGGFLLTGMDDATHKRIRTLLAPAFSPKAILEWKTLLAPVAKEAVDAIRPRGRADLIADLLLPLPVRMIYEIIGFPKDEEQTQLFAARAMRILVGPQRDPEKARISMESAFRAARELYDETLVVVRRRRDEGSTGNDLIGYLLRANDNGQTLDDANVTELIRQFLPAAAETTTRSLAACSSRCSSGRHCSNASAPTARSFPRSSTRGCAGRLPRNSSPARRLLTSSFAA
jgi:cytochrome P450